MVDVTEVPECVPGDRVDANIAGAQLAGVSDDEAILKIKELLEEMNKAGDI